MEDKIRNEGGFEECLSKYSEMQKSETEFILELIRKNKPKKILEIGIAAGSSLAFILDELRKTNQESEVYGIDYSENYYREPDKKSGWIVRDFFDNEKDNVTLYTGGLAACFMDKIGDGIDFCIIDTMHILPGELLDFLMVLPYLKDGAICVLHDVNLQNLPIKDGAICVSDVVDLPDIHFSDDAYATGLLASILPSKKIFPDTFLKQYGIPNITAFRVTPMVRDFSENVFLALSLPWRYELSEKDINLIKDFFFRKYSGEKAEYFEKIAKVIGIKTSWKKQEKDKEKAQGDKEKERFESLARELSQIKSSGTWRIYREIKYLRSLFNGLSFALFKRSVFQSIFFLYRRYLKRFVPSTVFLLFHRISGFLRLIKHFFERCVLNRKYRLIEKKLSKEALFGIHDRKPGLVFQVEAFDKGGLEEVVLMLASNKSIRDLFNVFILTTGNDGGHMCEIARKKGIPVIGLDHDLDFLEFLIEKLNIKIVNLHYSLFGIELYKRHSVRTVYTIHNNYIWMDDQAVAIRREKYNLIDTFIAVSDQVRDFFSERFSQDKDSIKVIVNGIDLDSLKEVPSVKKTDFGLSEDDFVFLNVASFGRNKYHPLLIEAMGTLVKKFDTIKLLLVGNVSEQEYFDFINKKIVEKGLSGHIKIVDYIPKETVFGLMRRSDCFVLPSITEGLSIAMIEAMYNQLPLILSDVGGARDAIDNNDIGFIIRNPYEDILKLNPAIISEKYASGKDLSNIDDLVSAMEEVFTNRFQWKERARMGKSKVETFFNAEYIGNQYAVVFNGLDLAPDSPKLLKESDIRKILETIDISIVAPFPSRERVQEGWMSRISAVDRIFSEKKRIYLNISAHHDKTMEVRSYSDDVFEVLLSPNIDSHKKFTDSVIKSVDVVYVHTLHLAEYILPWLSSRKIVVDFHGITPEEEAMMGRSHLVKKYEMIEKSVLAYARKCVMVTNAMKRHYEEKYPEYKPEVTILPIVESMPSVQRSDSQDESENPVRIIYSGGNQSWQNTDAMLDLAMKTRAFSKVRILSKDWKFFKEKADSLGIGSDITFSFCEKTDLFKEYAQADFGLVLRDNTPVNRVACPTKLFEYMHCGVIPVMRCESIGDFEEFGYSYLREVDILSGSIPDHPTRKNMINNNLMVIKKIQGIFDSGVQQLRQFVDSDRIIARKAPEFGSLADYRRHYLLKNVDIKRMSGLEIGAFMRPTVSPDEGSIRFLDFYSTEELQKQARESGEDESLVVPVAYVVKNDYYDAVVRDSFDYIIANHVIEHISNPIKWLRMLQGMLTDNGILFLVIPDKKYNFDKFRTDTPLSYLLSDYLENVSGIQTNDSIDAALYYDMRYVKKENVLSQRLNQDAIKNAMTDKHPGLHSHVFQGELFLDKILKPILYMKLLDFHILDYVYSTQIGEFIVVLKKGWKPIDFSEKDFYTIASDSVMKKR